jgi:hypothetical protein
MQCTKCTTVSIYPLIFSRPSQHAPASLPRAPKHPSQTNANPSQSTRRPDKPSGPTKFPISKNAMPCCRCAVPKAPTHDETPPSRCESNTRKYTHKGFPNASSGVFINAVRTPLPLAHAYRKLLVLRGSQGPLFCCIGCAPAICGPAPGYGGGAAIGWRGWFPAGPVGMGP